MVSTASTVLTGGTLIAFGLEGLAAVASHFLVTTALGAALKALSPSPGGSTGVGGYSGNAVGSDLDRQIIYGETVVGGVTVYSDVSASVNRVLHRVLVFAGHEIEEFVEFYIDGNRVVDINPDGTINGTEMTDGTISTIYDNGNAHIFFKTGAPNQSAFSELVDEYVDKPDPSEWWTSAHKLEGHACVYFRSYADPHTQRWPNGIPQLTAKIKGKKVLDPRNGMIAYSASPALCIADYLTSDYGIAEIPSRIDYDLVATAATIGEQTNTPQGEVRYELNGAFLTSSTPYDFLAAALQTMGGGLWYAQGQWRMKPAYWTTPVLTIGEDELRGQLDLNTRHSRRDQFNQVKGTYRGEETFWQVTDYPVHQNHTSTGVDVPLGSLVVGEWYEITSLGTTDWEAIAGTPAGFTFSVGTIFKAIATGAGSGTCDSTFDFFLDIDNGQESVVSVDQPFVTNAAQCKRLARIALERSRQQLTLNITTNLESLNVQVGDNIFLNYTRFGWTNKAFEVVAWGFYLTEELEPRVSLSLREVSAEVFDDKDDALVLERDNTDLTNPFNIAAPTNLQFSSVTLIDAGDKKAVTDIEFTWDHPFPADVTFYEFQYRKKNATEWNAGIILRTNRFALGGVRANQQFEWRVRASNTLAQSSIWVLGTDAQGQVDTTIPKAPTSVSGTVGYRSIQVAWVAPTQNTDNSTLEDLEQYFVFRDGNYIGSTVGTSLADNGLAPSTNYTYTVKAVDKSGNESALSSGANIVTLADPADGVDGISVLIVYSDDAVGTTQSLTPGTKEYVNYYEYNTGAGVPSVPLPVGTVFVKFIGVGQSIFAIYADDAAGNNQSFTQGVKPFVNFFESVGGPPSLPQGGLTWVRQAGIDGTNGGDAVSIYISGDDQTITYDSDGNISPASQDFNMEAFDNNISGATINWTTSPNVKVGTGQTFTLDEADFGLVSNTAHDKIVVTATVTGGFGTRSDKFTITKLVQGSGAVTPTLSNEAVVVATDAGGGNPVLGPTDTGIELYQGINQFTATTGVLTMGKFKVLSTAYTSCTGNQTGSASGPTYTMGDLSGISADRAKRVFTIQAMTYPNGVLVNVEKTQHFSRIAGGIEGQPGDRGAGRWHILLPAGVALPKNNGSLSLQTGWNTYGRTNGNNAPLRPVVGDQSWFQDEVGAQDVGICTSVSNDTNHVWARQDEVVDGNLLVTGTANIMNVAVNQSIESSSYDGPNGSAGFQLNDLGDSYFNGSVLSRNLVLNEGEFTYSGTFGAGSKTLYWVNSGIRLGSNDIWAVSKKTFIVVCALRSGLTGSGIGDGRTTYWGITSEIIGGAARWTGSSSWTHSSNNYQNDPPSVVNLAGGTGVDQRILFNLHWLGDIGGVTGSVSGTNPRIAWKVYQVT